MEGMCSFIVNTATDPRLEIAHGLSGSIVLVGTSGDVWRFRGETATVGGVLQFVLPREGRPYAIPHKEIAGVFFFPRLRSRVGADWLQHLQHLVNTLVEKERTPALPSGLTDGYEALQLHRIVHVAREIHERATERTA